MKKGIGLYVRRLAPRIHGTPEEFAKNLQSNGVSFVAFMACWQDGKGTSNPNRGKVNPYARACSEAGVEVWLWGFPRPQGTYQTEYFDCFASHTQACGGLVKGWLHDPEVYWQKKGVKPGIGMRGQGEAIRGVTDSGSPIAWLQGQAALFVRTDAARRAGLFVPHSGFTSYGAARWFGLPWAEFAPLGMGSPQIYSADTRTKVQGYLSDWRAIAPMDLRPSLPTFGENSGSKSAVLEHASKFLDPDGSVPSDIGGFWFWSWEQTKGQEWAALKALAGLFK